jgi:predicted transcriptional regulator
MDESTYEKIIRELEARKEDIRPSDVILFSEPFLSTLNFFIRLGRFSLTEFAEKLELSREKSDRIMKLLVAKNLFSVARYSTQEETYYQTHLSSMTRPLARPPSDLWKKID